MADLYYMCIIISIALPLIIYSWNIYFFIENFSFCYCTISRRHCFFVVTPVAHGSYILVRSSSAVIPELLERGYRIYVTFLVNHFAISSSLHLGQLWSMCCSSSITNINSFCSIETIEVHEIQFINVGLNACTIGILT